MSDQNQALAKELAEPRSPSVTDMFVVPSHVFQLGMIPQQIKTFREAPNYILFPSTVEGKEIPVAIWHHSIYADMWDQGIVVDLAMDKILAICLTGNIVKEHGSLHFTEEKRVELRRHVRQMVLQNGYKSAQAANRYRPSTLYPVTLVNGQNETWNRVPAMFLQSNLLEATISSAYTPEALEHARQGYLADNLLMTSYQGTVNLLGHRARWTLEHPILSIRHVMMPEDVVTEMETLVRMRVPFLEQYVTDWEVFDPVNPVRVGGEDPRKPIRSVNSIKHRFTRNLID